jgi:transcriptional regulator with XRE-family HTH domain
VKRNEQAERETLKRRLRQAIAESGMLKYEVGDRADVSIHMLGRYTAGKCIPPCLALARIATATGVSADWLLGLTDNKRGYA